MKGHFGEESLFYDVDSIPFGLDFRKEIEKALNQCKILLAIIDENWVNVKDIEGKRRLDNPNDLSASRSKQPWHATSPALEHSYFLNPASLALPEESPAAILSRARRIPVLNQAA